MPISQKQKKAIKNQIKDRLSKEDEIEKIILFGSFVTSEEPNDIDIAIFQNSDEKYLTLAMKYRKLTRDIAKIIPIDIIPVKSGAEGAFMDEINTGEIIYER